MGRKKGSKNKKSKEKSTETREFKYSKEEVKKAVEKALVDENRKTETAIEERHNIENPICENEENK